MSSNRFLVERLPWYLNGSLDETESAEIEKHLAESSEARRELAQVQVAARIFGHRLPTEVIVAYAFDGEHPDVPAELVERYVAVSPLAAEELELIRQSQAALESDAPSVPLPDGLLPFVRPSAAATPATGWRRLALAASLAGVTALGMAGWQWIDARDSDNLLARTDAQLREALAREEARPVTDEVQRRRVEELEAANSQLAAGKSDLVDQIELKDGRIERLQSQIAALSEPLLNIPVVDVWPGDMVLRGEPQAERVVIVPRQTRTVALILNSGIGKDQKITGMNILTADGTEVWSSPVRPERDELGTFTIALPVQELDVGRYTLQLVEEQDGQTKIVETYQVEIR